MSPSRRSPKRPVRRTPPQRRASALGRRDLEGLLEQLDSARVRAGATGRTGRAEIDEADLTRLRRLVTQALDDREGGAGDQVDDQDSWDDEPARDEDDPYDDDPFDDPFDDDPFEDDPFEDDEDDGWGGWSPRRGWARYSPAAPIPVDGGIATRSRRGAIGETWWSKRFLSAIEALMAGGRLARGRSYARKGQVLDLDVTPGMIQAKVQGTRRTPYRVRLAMPAVGDEDWARITEALASEAGFAARLLAGELPHEIEDVFATEGVSLFPSPGARLTTDCTCPDWANPCKHIAAVCYVVAESFDRDPFAVLSWRGRDRDALLAALRELRTGSAAAPAPVDDASAPAAVEVPPLEECVLGFWKAGPELAEVRVRPEAAELPAAVLRHLAPGLIEIRGRDVGELLAPAYPVMAAAAARRAVGDGGPPAKRSTSGR